MGCLGYIQRAVDFIEENLQQRISFVDVAQAAGFSPFHFQRIFSGVAGESVTDYIRRRRFAAAARQPGETYQYIFGTYFPRTGKRTPDAPDFELYDQRFDPDDPASEMEIYIPIEQK